MTWAPDYITTAEMKTYLRIGDSVDDTLIGGFITAASRAVDRATYRQFGKVAASEARKYTPRWDSFRCRWVVPIDDLMDAAGLTVATAAGAITQYSLVPLNATFKSRPWTGLVIDKASTVQPINDDTLPGGITCTTDKWGWSAVPETVKSATKIQTSRFFKRRDAPFGVAGSPDVGSELRLLAKVDPDVALMLVSYARTQLAVG